MLLEVLVALVLVAVAGTATATLAADAARAAARVRAGEAALRRANTFLEAVALWPREDLDRHLGERAEGPWILTVARPTPVLYEVTLRVGGQASRDVAADVDVANGSADVAAADSAAADSAAGAVAGTVLLTTALYRPFSAEALGAARP